MADKFDVVVVGGGPAGYAAALYGAAAGLNIAMVEKDKVGGTCLHRGCIPAKELLETATVRRTVAHASDFGISAGEPTLDLGTAMERKQKVVDGLHKGLSGLLKGRKVTVLDGFGRLGADRTVTVENGEETTEITGDHVILCPGSVPRTIPGFDFDADVVISSDHVFDLTELPARVAVIGGGAIGCEFASMFSDLGSEVTVLEVLDEILPGVDPDVIQVVRKSFKRRGIDVRTGVKVEGHEPGNGGTAVQISDGEPLEVDMVVVSVGRRALTDDVLGEGTGVQLDDRGFVEVDEWCATSAEGVWAAGDAIATPGLAHVGFAEAIVVIKQILGEDAVPVDHDRVPWCVYCHPEVAFAGLTEEQATEAGHEVQVSKHQFRGNGRAMIVGETDGLVKVVADKDTGVILGVHMVGPWVTEQLGQGYLAVNWEATAEEAAHFIQPHPTMSELFGETVMALTGRGLHG